MSDLERGRKLALNPKIINKHEGGDARYFAYGWVNDEVSVPALMLAVQKGWAFTTQHDSPRRSDNFRAADLACVDIDDGLQLEEVMDHPLVREHALFVYTTCSHTQEQNRVRVAFDMPRTITKAREIRAINRALTHRLQGDAAAIDPVRVCFGNTNAEFHVIGRQVSPDLLEELIADGSRPANPGLGSRPAETTRSVLTLRADEPLLLGDGSTASLANLPQSTRVHCPYHDDRNASAFVTQSKRGTKGVHCSACAKTYWSQESQEEYDFGDFEKVLRQAQEARKRGETHAEGLVPGSPAERILMGPDTRIVSGRATPPLLLPHLTLIRSPKGSGKTEGLVEILRDKRSVLVIGHRRSLLTEASRRLGVAYYLDDPDRVRGNVPYTEQPVIDDAPADAGPWPGGEFFYAVQQAQKQEAQVRKQEEQAQKFTKNRLAICVDSLMQISPNTQYDAVVFDESEQVFAHFLSETMAGSDGPGPHRLFTLMANLVLNAKCIIALDADLGWTTFDTLHSMLAGEWLTSTSPEKVVRVWLNEAQPSRQEIEIHASKNHLIGELKQAVLDGKRVFVTANSRTLIEKLEAGLRELVPDKRIIAITSETISSGSVQEFLAHPKAHALAYAAILTSPAMGTGIDLTFPGNAKLIDVVFGFCEPMVTTHTQFDQQLGRVRHPGAVKVWVSPQTFRLETNMEVVQADLRRLGRHHDQLVGYDDSGHEIYREDTPLIRMAAMITAEDRASKNNLRANFIWHKEAQGCTIVHVSKDLGAAAGGYGLTLIGTQIREEAYAERILQARVLNHQAFERVKKRLESGGTVRDEELWAYHRTRLEVSYREQASTELIQFDQRGRRRGQVRLLEGVIRRLGDLDRLLQDPLEPFGGHLRYMRTAGGPAFAITRLMRLTPFYTVAARDGSTEIGDPNDAVIWISPETGRPLFHGCLNFGAVAEARDMPAFAGFVRANKAVLETQLGIPIRADVEQKPMQQLGTVMTMLGLPFKNPTKLKVSGETIRRYQIDPDDHEAMTRVMQARKRIRGWQFMTDCYGPEMNPYGQDDGREDET